MVSFWGMNDSGKESAGLPREMQAWQFQQFKDQLANMNTFKDRGNEGWNWATDYWKNRADKGIGSTQEVRAAGENIMPGLTDALGRRRDMLSDLQSKWGQVPKAGDTAGQIRGFLDQKGGNIGQQWTGMQNEIDSAANNVQKRIDTVHDDQNANIDQTFNWARDTFNQPIKSAQDRIAKNYGGLLTRSGDTTKQELDNLEIMRPGSEFAAARAARNFAPQVASTMGNLRRAGIDPNSVQAASLIGSVQAQRGRAMDDAMADGLAQYALAKNKTLDSGLSRDIALTGDMTGGLTGLDTMSATGNRDLVLGRGAQIAGENSSWRDLSNLNDTSRRDLAMKNLDSSFQAGQNLLDQRGQLAQLERGMGQEDFGMEKTLNDQRMAEEMVGPEAYAKQFQLGQDYATTNASTQDRGASGQTGLTQMAYGNMWNANQAANQAGKSAMDAALTNYGIQAPKAGWGTKLLTGLGSAGLNLLVPGLGSAVGGAIPGGSGGGGFSGLGSMLGGWFGNGGSGANSGWGTNWGGDWGTDWGGEWGTGWGG
jgi:hypothetical protein